jgi:6,7-dimethyl-8-ribityllumazine synthase
MENMNRGSRLVYLLTLTAGLVSADLIAQSRQTTDAALGRLIEKLADRRSDGLVAEERPDGSVSVDLQGRFQQVTLGQVVGDDLPMVQCVNSIEEANVFFGRDLRTGGPLPPEAKAEHEALVEEARRHGMSAPEYQFYMDLIEQGSSAPQLSAGSTITIVNNDGPNEGFNSPAPQFLPAPGNDSNANLGEQRLALFNAAAEIWGAFLDSSVTIEILAQFDPLACSSFGAVLGSAGPNSIIRDFANAEFSNTFYHVALANKTAGFDMSASSDISTMFNSQIDSGCLGGFDNFYYGLDSATPAGTINLFVVLLHEMGHGLGSSSFTGSNGQFPGGFPDIWARFLFDTTAGLTWFQMNNAQRAASAVNPNNVYWDGANVRVASGFLSGGRDAATGRVQMYTPNPYEGGSSVSHYNTAAFPNLLMEPSINSGLPLTLDLTRQQMRDIGWYRDSSNDLVPDTITSVAPSNGSLQTGSQQNITWTNTGSFSNNVTIELSLDGGGTWPTVIASDVANTGSYAWVVPNSPTSQARVRVREHDFLAPLGQSAANFTIVNNGNTAPTFTPAGAQSRQQGSPPGAAVTVGTVSDGQTAAGDLVVSQVAGGTATGITVGSISNTGGTVTATLAAECAATAGTVRFEVSDGELAGTGDLQVNVTANSAPVLTYAGAGIDSGAGTAVNPLTGPADNGSIASIVVQDAGTYSGTISVGPAGIVSVSGAQPVGLHTITIRATDNCGEITDATLQLTVNNTAPTFVPAGAQSRQQGSPSGAAVTVGTVSDGQTAAGDLVVSQVAGGTATGITVGSISNTAAR